MSVKVVSSWAVMEHDGRPLHGQLEDHGVAGEKVLRNHWADLCPAGTDCSLGQVGADKRREEAS